MGRLSEPDLFRIIQTYTLKYMPNEKKLSAHTIRSYRTTLKNFLSYAKEKHNVPLDKLTFQHLDRNTVLDFLNFLEKEKNCSAQTRNQRLHSIQSFFKYAAREEMELIAYWQEIQKISPAKAPNTTVKYLSAESINLILHQPESSTSKGLRDAYLMLLMYKTGCRVQELANIRLMDVHLGKCPYIMLQGKGNKNRNVPIRKNLVEHTNNYLQLFHPHAHVDDYLIFTIRNNQKHRMTEDNIRKLVQKYGQKARQTHPEIPEKLHPHIFRHSFAMHSYQNGVPLELIQDWLGHADLLTTRIYAQADTEMKRKAIQRAFPTDSPLIEHVNSNCYRINDEDMLKKLCGLV